MILIDLRLFCSCLRDSKKTCLGRLRSRARPKSNVVTPHGLGRKQIMFPLIILILAVVLNQKLTRRTQRPKNAKLSENKRLASRENIVRIA